MGGSTPTVRLAESSGKPTAWQTSNGFAKRLKSKEASVFTGLVEEIGLFLDHSPQEGGEVQIEISGPLVASDAGLGDSISVDGVCLTVVDLPGEGRFTVEVVPGEDAD